MKQGDRLSWAIAEFINAEGVRLDTIIQPPSMQFDPFVDTLRDRLGLGRFTNNNMQQIKDFAEKYRQGYMANTNNFLHEISRKVEIVKERAGLFMRLHKHLKNTG